MHTRRFEEKAVRSYTMFLAVHHHFLIAGSANLSFGAERLDITLSLGANNPGLAEGVEKALRDANESPYETVA